MSQRSDVPPDTVGVELDPDGVFVEYQDESDVFYRGVPEEVEGPIRCQAGKQVHVLVTDHDGSEGVMVYVNDRKTHDEILELTGVGRIILEPGEETEIFPGVRARGDGHAVEVEADQSRLDGRVFVFEEDELGERSFELVNSEA